MALSPTSSRGAFNGGTITSALTVAPTAFATASLVVTGDTKANGSDVVRVQAADSAANRPLVLVDSTGDVVIRPDAANFGVFDVAIDAGPIFRVATNGQTAYFQGTPGVLIELDMANAKLGFYGAATASRPAAIANASGGAIQDAEARTALNSALAALRTLGLIAT